MGRECQLDHQGLADKQSTVACFLGTERSWWMCEMFDLDPRWVMGLVWLMMGNCCF